MVSAVSSQTATLSSLAYIALNEDSTSKPSAPDAARNDNDRGLATQVSLSQDARDRLTEALKQRPDAVQQAMDFLSQAGREHLAAVQADMQAKSEAMHRRGELAKINAQLRLFDQQDSRQDTNKAGLKRMQASYDRMLNSPISPEVTLNTTDAAKALKMLKEAGRTLPPLGPNVTYGFVKDGIQYNFRGDGTVTTRKEGVATSIEDQQKALASIRRVMDFISSDIQDNSAARAALIAQRDVLMGQ